MAPHSTTRTVVAVGESTMVWKCSVPPTAGPATVAAAAIPVPVSPVATVAVKASESAAARLPPRPIRRPPPAASSPIRFLPYVCPEPRRSGDADKNDLTAAQFKAHWPFHSFGIAHNAQFSGIGSFVHLVVAEEPRLVGRFEPGLLRIR